jgi:hypothetical protein
VARQRLAKANDVDQIKRIWCQAEAIRLEARLLATDPKLLRLAVELRLHAERKLGKVLTAMQLQGGDRKSPEFDELAGSKLQVLGVSKTQSSRWQRAASVPENRFRQYLRDAATQARLPTSAGLLKLARELSASGSGRGRVNRS